VSAFGFNDNFLSTKLGINTRAIKEPDENTSDLCVKAFSDLAAQHEISRSDIQLCCVVTQNPDRNIPHTSAIVHEKLGLSRDCMTFDISQGCAGYACGITIAGAVMERLKLDRALLFTCDPYSKIVSPDDKNTALIFGDAATVSYLKRDGAGYALVDGKFGTAPASTTCLSSNGVPNSLKMDGMAVLMNATREVPASIRELLEHNGKTYDDIDLFLLHPGSKRVVDLIRRELQIDEAKVPFEIGSYGNTISSSIPLMLKRQVVRKEHQRLVLSGFGVGFSWGSCLVELRS
jgi:3-oxoacyl-[acyl-carrier-protein] synthase-3